MNLARKRKLFVIFLIGLLLSIVIALVSYALRQNISLFFPPSAIVDGKAPLNQLIRVGGMVVQGSVLRKTQDLDVEFKITDYKHQITVYYRGTLPNLFREGQGIVAQGKLMTNGDFQANEVLAKHDEKYMPPQVKEVLENNKALKP